MQPLALAEITVPKTASIRCIRGVGWLVTDPERASLTVYDESLADPVKIPLPDLFGSFEASVAPDRSRAAVVTMRGLTVLDADGGVRWRRPLEIPFQGHPCAPSCLLTDDLCWLYLPDGDELLVYDAETGREWDSAPLATDVGAATFHLHPDGNWVGLHVAMGQDGSLSYWVRLRDGRIEVRDAPGECLTDLTTDGRRYLAMPHLDGLVCMRSAPDGTLLAEAEGEELPGFAAPEGYIVTDVAALLDDDLAIVGVEYDSRPAREQHLLLDTKTLRWQATLDYGDLPPGNSLRSAGASGRWLTHDRDAQMATLWRLPN